MRQLLRLRSFWCCALVLLLLGGLWVSSRIAPQEAQVHTRTEILRLRNQRGSFEIEWEIPFTMSPYRGTPHWAIHPVVPALPDRLFPPPSWKDWQKKKHDLAAASAASGFHIGSTNIAAWEELLAGKQRSAAMPHWLAMLDWVLLCLPLLAWRWRSAQRRSMKSLHDMA